MQLIAGRTAQEYNQRKATQGALWEDRYQSTAIESVEYTCIGALVSIDLNRVRAGVVNHPVLRDTAASSLDNSRDEEPLPAARLVWRRPSIYLFISPRPLSFAR